MLAVALMLSSCAEKKTFKKCDGTSFVASPYGWANKEKQIGSRSKRGRYIYDGDITKLNETVDK